MAKNSIQGYVELASGLGDLTRSRAKEAAQEIIALASQDTSRKKLAKQASALADDLLKAAEANRKQIVRLVRREVDSAVGKLDVDRLTRESRDWAQRWLPWPPRWKSWPEAPPPSRSAVRQPWSPKSSRSPLSR